MGDSLQRGHTLAQLADPVIDFLCRQIHARHCLCGDALDLVNRHIDVGGGVCRPFGQLADFVSDHGKAPTLLTGAGGFDGGIECQQVSLAGDVGNDAGNVADLGNRLVELVDGGILSGNGFNDTGGRGHALADVGVALRHLLL